MVDPDIVLSIVVTAQTVVLAFLLWSFNRLRKEQAARAAEKPAAAPPPVQGGNLEDVFLLHRSGLLLKHYTLRLRPNMDSDVLSGMLVAVQEFIKDSFRGEAGSLDEVRFGDMRIKIIEGKWTIIAALVRGEATAEHTSQMRSALRDLEARYEDLLIDWDGTMDRIPEVDRIMQRLIDGGYTAGVPAAAT